MDIISQRNYKFYFSETIRLYIFDPSIAGVAQLVERQPSKLNVASSNLVSRSKASFLRGFFISKY